MKALTVIQPWASLILLGAKRFETRSWKTAHRGPLLIHASAQLPPVAQALCYEEPWKSALAPLLKPYSPSAPNGDPWDLPLGALLGIVEVVDCVATESLDFGQLPLGADAIGPDEKAFGDYRPGRWAWQLRVLHRFAQPIPLPGHLGLWEAPNLLIPEGPCAARSTGVSSSGSLSSPPSSGEG